MSQSKKDPNEEWRNVFDKASETPPPEIWEGIESRLNQQMGAPLATPWWRKPEAWLSAASVLLVLGLGAVLFFQGGRKPASPASLATSQSGAALSSKSTDEPVTAEELRYAGKADAAVPGPAPEISPAGSPPPRENITPGTTTEPAGEPVRSAGTLAQSPERTSPSAGPVGDMGETPDKTIRPDTPEPLAMLRPLPYREIDTHWQTRYVFFNPYAHTQEEELPATKPEAGPLWAGLSIMPGGFNPNMQFSHASVYQMNSIVGAHRYNYSTTGALSANNRAETKKRDQPKVSYQAAAQFGVNLSKNWSLESGVAFLQGNSMSRSPGYFMDGASTQSADLLLNAMASGNANYSPETIQNLQLENSDAAAIYVPIDRNMNNTYNYLQVPAYLGYTFRSEKKFSYTLLGGGITNFFLKNDLRSAAGYTLKTTPDHNVYNSVVLSAATGVRVNYKLNQAWNTTLTANYQHALMNSFNENRFLTSRPQVYGIAWGVRYTFQH